VPSAEINSLASAPVSIQIVYLEETNHPQRWKQAFMETNWSGNAWVWRWNPNYLAPTRQLTNLNRNSVLAIELQKRLMSYPAFRVEAYFLHV
jgi:hypothetical protein